MTRADKSSESYKFDALGRLIFKTGVGSYSYRQPGAPGVKGARAPAEKRGLHEEPQPAAQHLRPEVGCDAILPEVGTCLVHGGEDAGFGEAVNCAKSASRDSA